MRSCVGVDKEINGLCAQLDDPPELGADVPPPHALKPSVKVLAVSAKSGLLVRDLIDPPTIFRLSPCH
jgi:hypothetical protein